MDAEGNVTFTPNATFTGTTSSIPYTVNDNDGNTSEPADLTVTYSQAPKSSIALEKVGLLDKGSDGVVNVGDVINYTFKVTNTGNVALTNVMISDPKVTIKGGPIASLAPAVIDSTTFTASYVLTQADINAGVVENTAEVAGIDPLGNSITDKSDDPSDPANVDPDGDGNPDDPTLTDIPQNPAMTLVKDKPINNDADGSGNITEGDTLTYTITATNTGNSTLTNVVVSDPLITPSSKTCASLEVSKTCVLTGSYVVTAQDAANGGRENTATVKSDSTKLVSASVSVPVVIVTHPPVAVDDSKTNQPLGQPVTIQTVSNDSDIDNNLAPNTVVLIGPTGLGLKQLVVDGEGTWVVDPTTGNITFTPEAGFIGDPSPVNYLVKDTTGLSSNLATIAIDYEEPAALTGTVWLDRDKDGKIDSNEERKAGWTLKIKDSDGNIIATTVTDANGNYSVTGLIPAEYSVEFYTPAGLYVATSVTDGSLKPGETLNLPLPIDPSGIVYDSTTREPLANVRLQLVNSQGKPVAESCLGEGQQNQVTLEDGLYAFDVKPDADVSCPNGDTYSIRVLDVPAGYYTDSTIIPPSKAVFDGSSDEANCTVDKIANSGSCEVQGQPDAPKIGQDTTYFMDFILESGDKNIIFNHLALDSQTARIVEIKDDAILLSKSVNKKQVSVGDQLYYTIVAENTTDEALEIDIRDDLPTGFKFTSGAAKQVKSGIDGRFDKSDYAAATKVASSGFDPVRFGVITIQPGEKVQIGYLLKVGTGAAQGNATNTAQAFATGSTTDIASNVATASVSVIADNVLDQSTLIGKVFHDRDGDGYQDNADATGVKVKSDYFGWHSLNLGTITGRVSVLDDPAKHRKIVRMPYTRKNDFKVITAEGTMITVDNHGQVSESHIGDKAKGLTAQEISVSTRRIRAIPTQTPVKSRRVPAKVMDVLEITITNQGIHEEGIPGVRLATVGGLLIETDGYGRYHIPDVDGGRRGSAKNFIIKVDPATLPQGARFTTENPRVLRLSGSALNKINFGVKLPVQAAPVRHQKQGAVYRTETRKQVTKRQVPVYRSVDVNLGSIFFDKDKYQIRADQRGVMADIAKKIKRYGRGHIIIDAYTDSRHTARYNIQLAKRRAFTVRAELMKRLGARIMRNVKVEVDPKAFNEVPHNDSKAIDYKQSFR